MPRDRLHQRRLAHAIAAHQGHNFPAADLKRQPIKHSTSMLIPPVSLLTINMSQLAQIRPADFRVGLHLVVASFAEHPAAHRSTEIPQGKLVIRNIGLLLSGDLRQPILEGDTIVAVDGIITAVGNERECNIDAADRLVDAKRTTVSPGLIDSHVHPVFGDWTPRQNQLGWMDSFLHGGVTTMISAGEGHLPGRPRDVVGLKALAITAQRAFSAFRPGGVKIIAGAPVVEKEMTEEDFRDLAAAGVGMLGEIGLGGVKTAPEAKKMVGWARTYGLQSTIH